MYLFVKKDNNSEYTTTNFKFIGKASKNKTPDTNMPKAAKAGISKTPSKDSMSKKSSKESLLPASKDNKIGYRWFCNTISNLLGIYDTKYAEDLVEEHAEQMKSFFDDEFAQNADIDKQIIFLWRTYYDKMVEETITVLEEGKKNDSKLECPIIQFV